LNAAPLWPRAHTVPDSGAFACRGQAAARGSSPHAREAFPTRAFWSPSSSSECTRQKRRRRCGWERRSTSSRCCATCFRTAAHYGVEEQELESDAAGVLLPQAAVGCVSDGQEATRCSDLGITANAHDSGVERCGVTRGPGFSSANRVCMQKE
jgi:hypothetical protein